MPARLPTRLTAVLLVIIGLGLLATSGSASSTAAKNRSASYAAPRTPSGCPPRPSIAQPAVVTAITPPARLLIDTLRSDPSVATEATFTVVVHFHVTSTCGGPVVGSLIYATATPYNQFTIPAEVRTGSNGWAEVHFHRLSGFPVSRHQQLIAMFVRARKPGESPLAGISTRRLVAIPVTLR